LNTHKDGGKPCLPHGLHEVVILHEIHAGFRTEIKGIVAFALPGHEGAEQAQSISPVPDEVIIHEKETPAPPKVVQQAEFRQHVLRGFGPRHAAIELGNITELAIKRTTTRK